LFPARVVAWARQGLRAPEGVTLIHAASGYEAAAEILAAPAAALVIDLGLLSPRHLGLLAVARNLNVDMLAFGVAPAGLDAEQLSGLRLVSHSQLQAALEGLARRGGPGAASATTNKNAGLPLAPAESSPAEPAPRAAPTATAAPAAKLTPAKPARAAAPPLEAPSLEVTLASVAQEAPMAKPVQAMAPSGLLSPEELAALLGEDER